MAKKLTDPTLTSISTIANDDLLYIVDKDDITDSVDGTSKKISYSQLVSFLTSSLPSGGALPRLTSLLKDGTPPYFILGNRTHQFLIDTSTSPSYPLTETTNYIIVEDTDVFIEFDPAQFAPSTESYSGNITVRINTIETVNFNFTEADEIFISSADRFVVPLSIFNINKGDTLSVDFTLSSATETFNTLAFIVDIGNNIKVS